MATTLFKSGGGRVEYKGTCLFSKENIDVRFTKNINEEGLLCFGDRKSVDNIEGFVTFTPAGNITPETLAIYINTFLALQPGECFLGEDECPLIVHYKNGKRLTFRNAVLFTPPNLRCARGDTLFGEVTFALLRGRDADGAFLPWDTVDSYYLCEDIAYPGDDASKFSLADVKTPCCRICWFDPITGAPLEFETKDGVDIAINADIEPVECDCPGIINYQLNGYSVTITAKPLWPDECNSLDYLRMQGPGALQGGTLTGLANDETTKLNMEVKSDTGLEFEFFGTELVDVLQSASKTDPRFGDHVWRVCGDNGTYPLFSIINS